MIKPLLHEMKAQKSGVVWKRGWLWKKEKYSKRNIEQKVPNDIKKESSKNIETNKNVAENKSDKTNANIDISNPNKQLKQSEKADLEQKDIIEEKPFEEEDLKLNALIKARGLENVGATCYMNSTLQCLYHVKQLSESLVNDDKIDEKLNEKLKLYTDKSAIQ